MKQKSTETLFFNIFAIAFTTLFAVLCIIPILLTLAGSFTPEQELLRGLKLIPDHFTTDAYKLVMRDPSAMLNAYGVTIRLVVIGTALSLFITTMTAYVLYRKDFPARNFFAFFFFFTTLFSGGLVPHYVWLSELGLRNTFTVLLTGSLFTVFNMIIVRSYFTGNIPQSLVESAKIDGAGDFRIYHSIVLPSAGPIIATVGLLTALAYWNNWQAAMIYITNSKLYPLQYYLYRVFQEAAQQAQLSEVGQGGGVTPTESYKLAMTVFTMGPVILFYPFVQKYFVTGVTVGAVKE